MSNVIKFYGKSNPKYFPFSNFFKAPFVDCDGIIWDTTEHFFQAMKFMPEAVIMRPSASKSPEIKIREYIRNQSTPKLAAQEGRRRDLPMRDDWNNEIPGLEGYNVFVKDAYMMKALRYKFSQHDNLKQLLLETGDAQIIEDSPVDYYWGCGKDGSGKNMLGKLLMICRSELRRNNV